MKLMKHQQHGVNIAHEKPRYYFAHEPGCGKTIMSLAIVSDAKAQGFVGKTLVLAPLSILHCAWANDAEHFPELKTVVVYSSKKDERIKQLTTPGTDVLVTNYETFKKLADEFYNAGVRRLIVDEASKAKNHDTQITKAIQRFSARCTSVYMLSGTPCANGAHEWIPQLMALKPDLFGGSYWQTMYRYFYPVKRVIGDKERIIGWRQVGGDDSVQPAGSAWQLIGSAPSEKVHPIKAEFLAKLRSCSWSLSKKECLDLPESRDVVREVELGDVERKAYDGMLESLRLEVNGETINAAMQARAMKLRQITGGAVLHDQQVSTLGNSKMDELLSVLEEIGDRPCVIWAEFTNEINRIAAAVGPNCQIINGQTPPQSRTDAVHQFQMGKLRRLVCHPAAAGHGITLTAASHAIYFSHGYSFETYQQSRDRIHRAGQHDPCTYWHLTATKTIDERILACLRHKKDAHQAIFDELGMIHGTESEYANDQSNRDEVQGLQISQPPGGKVGGLL